MVLETISPDIDRLIGKIKKPSMNETYAKSIIKRMDQTVDGKRGLNLEYSICIRCFNK